MHRGVGSESCEFMNIISCLPRPLLWGCSMIATGVNKPLKRRRGPLFFLLVFFRFLLNKTENEIKNKINQQTERQWIPTPMANWRFTDNLYYGAQGMSIRAFLTAADNEATAFSSQFSLITLSFLCQYINKTGFRACVKELFVQQHDPLSVSYAVLPGEKALKLL